MKTHFHMKDFALDLALKMRLTATRGNGLLMFHISCHAVISSVSRAILYQFVFISHPLAGSVQLY